MENEGEENGRARRAREEGRARTREEGTGKGRGGEERRQQEMKEDKQNRWAGERGLTCGSSLRATVRRRSSLIMCFAMCCSASDFPAIVRPSVFLMKKSVIGSKLR